MTNYPLLFSSFALVVMAYLMLILTEQVVNFVRTSKMWDAYLRIVFGINIAKVKDETIFKMVKLNGFIALLMTVVLGWGVMSKLFAK
ncbi:hypothetical protein QZM35_13635 [Burkholderia sp. AU45274]|uniref:hypothetical protein n=1 Tax=Burkholderia sp. AU45274 TaxID=3059205 RepID=UPI00265342C1|nr:hypothetical protein [Burkholderia sp. AU45274]MDN7488743.1 hypothetical protein [Burkholderia sp. AU45274]